MKTDSTSSSSSENEGTLRDVLNSVAILGDNGDALVTVVSSNQNGNAEVKTKDEHHASSTPKQSPTDTKINLKELSIAFEQGVDVRTHRYRLKSYPQTFVGSDAIDFLLSSDLATSRDEAVEIGQALQKKYNLFHHVYHDHDFQDDYLFYKFVDKSERFDHNIISTSMTTVSEQDNSESLSSMISLEDIAIRFEKGVPLKNRKRRTKTYSNSFVGSEAVDFLMALRVVETRNEAVQLAQRMANELDLFQSATLSALDTNSSLQGQQRQPIRPFQLYNFRDEQLFYTFIEKSKRKPRKQTVARTSIAPSNATNDHNSSKTTATMITPEQKKVLIDIAIALKQGVHITDRKYRRKVYKDCFVASMAIDFFVNSSMATTRKEAVQLGRQLAQELNLFQHVTGDHQFKDDYLFFEFTDESKIDPMFITSTYEVRQMSESDLERVANKFLEGVSVKTHRYNFIPYKKSFIGSQAVDYLVHSNQADSRVEAVKLGRELVDKLNLFQHVTQDHLFKDEYLFYRFVENLNGTEDKNGTNSATLLRKSRIRNVKNAYFQKRLAKYSMSSQSSLSSTPSENSKNMEDLIKAFQDENIDTSQLKEAVVASDCFDLENMNHVRTIFRHGVQVSDRTWMFKKYKNVFVGTEAVDFLLEMEISTTRNDAVKLGRELVDQYQLFEHVMNKHDFKDSHLFYRFTSDNANLMDTQDLDDGELMNIAKQMETEIQVKSNRYRLRVYKNTFVGTDAINYLVESKLAKSRLEAVIIGRSIAKKFNLFEHVTNDHRLKDELLFYRFLPKVERRSWHEDEHYHLESQKVEPKRFSDDWMKRATEFEKKISEKTCCGKNNTSDISDSLNKDILLNGKLIDKGLCTDILTTRFGTSGSNSTQMVSNEKYDIQSEYATEKGYRWATSFRRLDPRYQIAKFFNDVAQEGADEIEDKGVSSALRPLLQYFARASVFSVWRPTSSEAIRKLMLGDAVGKGLDIKGKSAKRGILSGYVPFLQISKNSHKRLISTLPKDKSIRIFFAGYSKKGRNQIAEQFEEVADDMTETVKLAKFVLENKNSDEEARADAFESLSLEMTDPTITFVDEYAPYCYGLDVPIRLFWEFYVAKSDISREPGGELDVGRPSLPAFQDMNNATLICPQKFAGAPRPVVWQIAGMDKAYCPLHLVMAYEEHGRVKPVVSDFDSFLVGTRGVKYSKPMPPEQVSAKNWCVSSIGAILDSPPRQESWTNRWLEVSKNKGSNKDFRPKIPQYGFGDPKSYSIMEHAVDRLAGSGAVRHGAECFNFVFPQELDEEFLIISDPGIVCGTVAWQYVDQAGLQKFLTEMINRGYTFPLNPKWILCDPGWKDIYDKLLDSDRTNVQESLNTWFPKNSGIREKIEEIYQKHPNGFTRERRYESFRRETGTSEMDLAVHSLNKRRCSYVT